MPSGFLLLEVKGRHKTVINKLGARAVMVRLHRIVNPGPRVSRFESLALHQKFQQHFQQHNNGVCHESIF